MHKNSPSASIKESIAELEVQQAEEKRLLKEELSYVFEHLKPSNVIRDTVMDLITTMHVKKNILNTALGAGAGYLASAVFGPKPTLLNKLGARFLKQVVNLVVIQNSGAVTDLALNLVTSLRRKVESQRKTVIMPDDLLQTGGEAI
jgi:hypothetical protein